MIKINLLPVRAAEKKAMVVQQIALFFAGVIVVLAAGLMLYGVQQLRISDTKRDIATANEEINNLKAQIGELEKLERIKEEVRSKLNILNQLRKNKIGPAQRLATLSTIAPEQLWLTGYSEAGSDIKISGLAFNEELIATFMRALEASTDYMNVVLIVSEQAERQGNKLKRFEIRCMLRAALEAQESGVY